MRIPFNELKNELNRVLLKLGFSANKAAICSEIFTRNSLDGVYSHGLNRFPVFVNYVKEGAIAIDGEPVMFSSQGSIEKWDGQMGPGMYNASLAMERATTLAREHGLGAVAIKNTNHWMRGGTYGWQAAEANCLAICSTNTIANMPPWGGKEPRLGNNPLVIAIPRMEGHIVLDMAITQYSYGKLQEHSLKNQQLDVPGGYDENGQLSRDPASIIKSHRALPIGFWKGSGLSFALDVMLTVLTEGNSTFRITGSGREAGVSQIFLCIHQDSYPGHLVEEIIQYTRSSATGTEGKDIYYPGERTLATRRKNESEGIPVNEEIWEMVKGM